MRDYKKPIIEEEVIEIEDIIATSPAGVMVTPVDDFSPTNPGDEITL